MNCLSFEAFGMVEMDEANGSLDGRSRRKIWVSE